MKSLIRSLELYRPFWWAWILLAALAAVSPLVVLGMTLVEKQLIDGVITARHVDGLAPTMLVYAALWVGATVAAIVNTLLSTYLNERLQQWLRQRMFTHIDALSLSFSHAQHSGRTMTLFGSDVPMVAGLLGSTVFGLMNAVFMLVISAVTMLGLSLELALVAGVIPPLVGGVAALVTRPLRPATRRVQEKSAELSERILENLAGVREIVAFGLEHSQARAFLQAQQQLLHLRMRLAFMDTGLQTGQMLFSLGMTVVILGFGGYLVIQGAITIGTLFAVRSLYGYSFVSVGQIFGAVANVQRGLAAVERVYGFLDQRPVITDRRGARELVEPRGAVAFDHVSFAYDGSRMVLSDLSFEAKPGELVALVGPSGAGKSTLVSLIARSFDPTAGRVLLDGVDLRDLKVASLRHQIAPVFQDSFLFATTIRENITAGREGASEGDIIAAAAAANAWEFIQQLPHGLDTPVGQRGARLSEGQRQRIAIARALLRDPRILILDEPTSALDTRTEHALQEAFGNLMRGRTSFVVAHRLATVRKADRILVLDQGLIVESGTHDELLDTNGLYRELFELQFGPSRQATVGAAQALARLVAA